MFAVACSAHAGNMLELPLDQLPLGEPTVDANEEAGTVTGTIRCNTFDSN